MMQVSVSRRHLIVFTTVIALLVSAAWVGVASGASVASATPVVYVATGENFPDALGASSAAAVQGGPVLLVTKTTIPLETKAELTRLSPDVIYVAGGTAVVSDSVLDALKAYAPSVIRLAGSNRYSTAAEVSKSAFPATLSGGGDTAALEAAVAALTARLDAFETSGKAADADLLDGLDSTALLGATGKAADSDRLDGLDSTAFLGVGETAADSMRLGGTPASKFVKRGEIVMTQSGNGWMVRPVPPSGSTVPTMVDRTSHSTAFTGDGWVVIGLTGPSVVDGSKYGLASFDLCLTGAGTPVLDVSAVAINRFVPPNTDDEDIYISVTVQGGGEDRASGCYTYVVNSQVGQGVGLQVTLSGSVELFSVTSRWSPAALGG